MPAACEKTDARQGGDLIQAECISCFTRITVCVRSYGMLLGETGMKSFRIKVGAAVGLLALLVGVAAPAVAFENPPPETYKGYAWVDCRKWNGPKFLGPFNAKGKGLCGQDKNVVILSRVADRKATPLNARWWK